MSDEEESSIADLVATAVGLDDESDEYWQIVHGLREGGDRATFTVAADLASSSDPRARALGVNVLAQLGYREGRPFLEESLPLVLEAVDDRATRVVVAAVAALGHLGDPRGLSALLRRREHADEDVRFSVAFALPSVCGHPPAAEAVDALISLMSDPVTAVRDWATFGLGTQLEIDSPRVRDALAARLSDLDEDTAFEALAGLAVRRDPRALEGLLRALADPKCSRLVVELAEAFASPELLGPLRRLEELGWADDPSGDHWARQLLARAIGACSGGSRNV